MRSPHHDPVPIMSLEGIYDVYMVENTVNGFTFESFVTEYLVLYFIFLTM